MESASFELHPLDYSECTSYAGIDTKGQMIFFARASFRCVLTSTEYLIEQTPTQLGRDVR